MKCKRENCDQSFNDKFDRVQHEKLCLKGRVVIPDTKPVQCDNSWCLKYFCNRRNLKIHQQTCRKKKSKGWHKCDTCGRRYTERLNLLSHQKRHISKQVYECRKCSKTYFRKYHFDKHVSICDYVATEHSYDQAMGNGLNINTLDAEDNAASISEKNETGFEEINSSSQQSGHIKDNAEATLLIKEEVTDTYVLEFCNSTPRKL